MLVPEHDAAFDGVHVGLRRPDVLVGLQHAAAARAGRGAAATPQRGGAPRTPRPANLVETNLHLREAPKEKFYLWHKRVGTSAAII